MAGRTPRSLADALRAVDDDRLAELLRRRPDLIHPVPTDITALAARATSGASVARCLDGLDALHLHVLRAVVEASAGAAPAAASAASPASAASAAASAASPASSAAPASAGASAASAAAASSAAAAPAASAASAASAAAASAAAPASPDRAPTAAAIVARAADGLGRGAVPACRAALTDLITLGLVWGTRSHLHAVLPAHDLVAQATAPPWPPPHLARAPVVSRPDDVDRLAAGHAREATDLVRDLLDDWSTRPPAVLRSGALSLRDFAAARERLHTDWARTALTIEVARAALLVADDEDVTPHWVPTDHYDAWLAKPAGEQWLDLVDAWLGLPRLASLADERTQVLATDGDRRAIVVLRHDTVDLLAGAEPTTAPAPRDIEAILDYREPRRGGELRRRTVAATLREAEDLGLTAMGAMSSAARALLAGTDTAAARRSCLAAFERCLPAEIDHVVVQADLTIVAPGPLAPAAARRLRMVADVESRGHATVFRIGAESVRRAIDAGWDAAAIRALLADLSTTALPQPLTYLIDDVARRHGAVRVGPALAYVRADDADLLATLLADRRLRALGLRRIAETVLVCPAPTTEVLTALRGVGLAPAAEGPDGGVVVRRPDERRIRTPRAPAVTTRRADPARLAAAAVRSLRAADATDRGARPVVTGPGAAGADLRPQSASAVVAALRAALADTRAVWLGYAGTDGVVGTQIVDPIRLHSGVLTAFDHRTDTVRNFAVSRITAVTDA